MKKYVFLCIFVFIVPMFIQAQGLYFDIGLNFGYAGSTYGYEQVYDSNSGEFPFLGYESIPYEIHFDLNAGYGPFGNIPVYVVANGKMGADLGIMVGTLFYPWRILQLGASVGVNWMPANSLSYNSISNAFGNKIGIVQKDVDYEADSHPGFAWGISAAFDFGKKNHGFLLGLKYSGAVNNFSYSYTVTERKPLSLDTYTGEGNGTKYTALFTLFVKYAYRKKPLGGATGS
jgi:hypothetical protein